MSQLIGEVRGQVAMQARTKEPVSPKKTGVVLGIPEADFPWRMVEAVEDFVKTRSILTAGTSERLRETVARHKPPVILIDARILGHGPLQETLIEFTGTAHVVVVAPYSRQPEVARLVAEGQIDFVPREGEWQSLAASLIERRLRWSPDGESSFAPNPGGPSDDLGEIFRHEINNPLTGILGNAELLLAHSDGFPAIETQRIRTVVELAVRLREAVRRVSNLWDKRSHSKSA